MKIFGKRSESYSVDELLSLKDGEINALLKTRKGIPYRSAKELRQAAKDDRRRLEGEKGIGAMLSGLKGGGTGNQNYNNIPLKDRVHPARYKQILDREARKQGLL